jgi:hypothetical protein
MPNCLCMREVMPPEGVHFLDWSEHEVASIEWYPCLMQMFQVPTEKTKIHIGKTGECE